MLVLQIEFGSPMGNLLSSLDAFWDSCS